jgi:hypothetical protein
MSGWSKQRPGRFNSGKETLYALYRELGDFCLHTLSQVIEMHSLFAPTRDLKMLRSKLKIVS